jgi:hypothetical protein
MPASDYASSYQTVDGLETVTYYQRATESTFNPPGGTLFTHAKRRAPSKVETMGPAGALLAGITLIWHLWTVDLGAIVPKAGDVIQDASTNRWTLVEVEVGCMAQRYRCKTYRER